MSFIVVLIGIVIAVIGIRSKQIGKEDRKDKATHLIWYQIGDAQKDLDKVVQEVNKYTKEKIGVTIEIRVIGWAEYSDYMKTIIESGQAYDLAFTSSWANEYLLNAQKGAFLPLNELLEEYGQDMLAEIDKKFWEGVKIGEDIYGVPSQKEIAHIPMWVFTKEYADKYNIPYKEIHTLEDLEPYLKIIKENEPDVIPFYVTKNSSVPFEYEQIIPGIGVAYDKEDAYGVKLYETEAFYKSFETMNRYYEKGYINANSAIITDDKSVKRFVTKGDGQPYAEYVWSRDLGYTVVATPISEVSLVKNESVRGAITAVSATSKHPEEAVAFLNLLNTDEYLRNLLNYGIEGVHYEKIEDTVIRLNPENKSYMVPNYVQGNLFKTYTVEGEPIDKWRVFKEVNDSAVLSPILGFNFDISEVTNEVEDVIGIIDGFAGALHTGTIDPKKYLPKLNQMLKEKGIDKIIDELDRQLEVYKKTSSE